MEIVFEKEFSRYGNDCIIKEAFSIIEIFGKYMALYVTYYSGWMGDQSDEKSQLCDFKDTAMDKLNEWGLEYAEQHDC